jgi:putative ABC transport system permease protein
MRQDLVYAFRNFGRNPGFTAVAVIALALGIGANTAIFSVVNAVLLRPLPYQNPEGLMYVWASNPSLQLGVDDLPLAVAELYDYRDRSKTLEKLTMVGSSRVRLGLAGDNEMVDGVRVTGDFFPLFGVAPILGNTFGENEDKPGAEKIVVLSHNLWQRRFGGRADVIGQRLEIDGKPYRVSGVMPPQFTYPHSAEVPKEYGFGPQAELWTAMQFSEEERKSRGDRSYITVGRLRPGATAEQAKAEVQVINAALLKEYPEAGMGWGVRATRFVDQIAGRARMILLVLLSAVAIILLIACANVANLLLARAAARKREIALRAALGADRGRIIRQLLTESVLLSLAGAALALIIGNWAMRALVTLSPGGIPRLGESSLDFTVFGFTLALAVLTGALFGLAPALTASKADLADTLKQSARSVAGGGGRLRSALVVAEVALAVMLLAGAGLLVRSFANLLQTDPGFRKGPAVTMAMTIPNEVPRDTVRTRFEDVVRAVEALPNVATVGIVNEMPLGGGEQLNIYEIEGKPRPKPREAPFGENRVATPGYFRAMGIRLIDGRLIEETDTRDKPLIAVVNEKLRDTFFAPGENPIGRRIRSFEMDAKHPQAWMTIVGVVANVRHAGIDVEPRAQIYRAQAQQTRREVTLVTRLKSGDANAAIPAIRNAVKASGPEIVIDKVITLDNLVSQSVSRRRYNMLLLGAFAGLALIMTIVGLYGVLSYSITQRTREMGVRIALGASSSDLMRQVVGEGLQLAAVGAVIGVAGALALTRVLAGLLYGVSPYDPLTLTAVVLLLLVVAAVACWIPARRAARLDPMVALRAE